MPRKELFYYVTWGSNVTRNVHWCVTVFYQQMENSDIANQIHGFTIDYGKFILISVMQQQVRADSLTNISLGKKTTWRSATLAMLWQHSWKETDTWKADINLLILVVTTTILFCLVQKNLHNTTT